MFCFFKFMVSYLFFTNVGFESTAIKYSGFHTFWCFLSPSSNFFFQGCNLEFLCVFLHILLDFRKKSKKISWLSQELEVILDVRSSIKSIIYVFIKVSIFLFHVVGNPENISYSGKCQCYGSITFNEWKINF